MSQITIMRTDKALPEDMDAAREFLFGALHGFSPADEKTWRRSWKRIVGMEPGEMLRIEMVIPRNAKFHRKFFALLNLGFDAWEPPRQRKTFKGVPVQKNFEQFREDITIAAGFYEQTFNLKGQMKLKAKSIAFAKMDDAEFEKVYSAVADVLLEQVLTTYAGRDELDEIVEKVMRFNV